MCCLEMPSAARKCPHCHHFQNRVILFLYHPVIGVIISSIPLVGLMIFLIHFLTEGEKYEVYQNQIVVTEQQLVFGELKSGKTVGVIGTIQNTSPVSWREVQLHVDFLDATGQRIDVGHKEPNNFFLPANGTSSFKLSFPMEFAETNYAQATVKVTTAKDKRARW